MAEQNRRTGSYRHDVTTFAALLKQRLEMYAFGGGFTVLKELVQNADDARASRLDFVLLEEGLGENTPNKLLQGPALVAINDGPFSGDDEYDMCMASGSAKASDEEVVGRFGIGQQSVFHVCEAFFYVGRSAGVTTAGLLNPWFEEGVGDPRGEGWNGFSETDEKLMLQSLGPLALAEDGLVVWLPLRLGAHERREQGLLADGEDNVFDTVADRERVRAALTDVRLAALLPQARHLELIRCWGGTGSLGAASTPCLLRAQKRGSIPSLSRPQLKSQREASEIHAAGSLGVVIGEEDEQRHEVHLRERLGAPNRFAALRDEPGWPKVNRIDRKTARSLGTAKTAAVPQGAVTVISSPAPPSGAHLRIQRAVFYPLSKESWTQSIDGRLSWTITLHGYWFTDHGRNRVDGLEALRGISTPGADHTHVRSKWNRAVDEQLTRPCLLPSIRDAISAEGDARIDPEEIAIFLRALQGEGWLVPPGHALYQPAFSNRYELDEQHEGKRVLGLPGAAADAEYLRECLPDSAAVVFEGDPLLRNRGFDPWQREEVQALLDRIDVSTLVKSPEAFEHLIRFLEHLPPSSRLGLEKLVWRAAREGLLPEKRSQKARKPWVDLCNLIPAKHRLVVPLQHTAAIQNVAQNIGCPRPLLLPNWWGDEARKRPLWEPAGLVQLFTHLSCDMERAPLRQAIVMELGRPLELRVGALDSLAVFQLKSVLTGEPVRKTPQELRAIRAQKQLFTSKGEQFSTREVLKKLHGAMEFTAAAGTGDVFIMEGADPREWALESPTMASLFDALAPSVSSCSSDVDARLQAFRECLRHLPASVRDREHSPARRMLRLLLHGCSEDLVTSARRLWRLPRLLTDHRDTVLAVLGATGVAWRLIEPALLAAGSGARLSWLGVNELRPHELAGEIDEIEVGELGTVLDSLPASASSRQALLLFLPDESDAESKLPAHQLVDVPQSFTAAVGHAYLESRAPVPEQLPEVVLVRRSAGPAGHVQDRLIKRWGPQEQLNESLALASSSPSKELAELILEAIDSGADLRATEELAGVRWIPTDAGAFVTDGDIVRNQGLGVLLQGTPLAEDTVVSIRQHPAWPGAGLVPSATVSAERVLGALMPGSHPISDAEAFASVVLEIRRVPCDSLPEWRLMRLLPESSFDLSQTKLTALLGSEELGAARLTRFLRAAREQGHYQLWLRYLELGLSYPDWAERLPSDLEIRCADGDWRVAARVVWPGLPVPTANLPSKEVGDLLQAEKPESPRKTKRLERNVEARPTRAQLRDAGKRLETYFQPWLQHGVPGEVVAAFVCMLGFDANTQVAGFCQRLLRDAGSTPNRLRQDIAYRGRQDDRSVDKWVLDAHGKREFAIRSVEAGNRQRHISLAGTPHDCLTLAETNEFSLLGAELPSWADQQPGWLVLVMPPELLFGDEYRGLLTEALREGVVALVDRYLRRRPGPEFDSWWRTFAPDTPRRLLVNQRRIRAELPWLLSQLGCNSDKQLGPLLREVDGARQRLISSETEMEQVSSGSSTVDDSVRMDELAARVASDRDSLNHAERKLVRLARSDKSGEVLEKIRDRLDQYEYHPQKVLFELAQNADDATLQRWGQRDVRMDGPVLRQKVAFELAQNADDASLQRWGQRDVRSGAEERALEVRMDGAVLRLRHRGRAINECNTPADRERGYEFDLLHMLRLNFSDKVEQEGTTGKFGLGFKSVHLITDSPRVQSESLAFQIIGGFYPQDLPASKKELTKQRATEIELQVDPELASASDLIADFINRAELLPVFTAALTSLQVWRDGKRASMHWHPKQTIDVGAGVRLEVGETRVNGTQRELLAITSWRVGPSSATKHRYVILFALGENGPLRLPSEVASLWVTAPLDADWNLGFAVGGPFAIDVGRSQLAARSDENAKVARSLGHMLRQVISWLADHIEGHEVARSFLCPSGDTQALWTGLWSVFAGRGVGAAADAHQRELLDGLHADGRGLSRLLEVRDRLPTGLRGDWRGLTSADKVKWMLPAQLDEQAGTRLLKAVLTLGDVVGALPKPGEVVANATGQVLGALGREIPELFLGQILKLLPEEPTLAHAPGINALRRSLGDDDRRMVGWLSDLSFPSRKAGASKPANMLLIPVHDLQGLRPDDRDRLVDDKLRAGFAAPERVIDPAWVEDVEGMELAVASRSRLQIGKMDEMVGWALEARSLERQQAVLRYLLDGRYGAELGSKLASSRPRWLASFPEAREGAGALGAFGKRQREALLVILFRATTTEQLVRIHEGQAEADDGAPTEERTLEDMVDWFNTDWTGPTDMELFGTDSLNLSSPEDEGYVTSWLALVIRACLFSMGWNTPRSNRHGGFMKMLWSKGWLAELEAKPSAGLVRVLAEYMEPKADAAVYMDRMWSLLPAHWLAGVVVQVAEQLRQNDDELVANPRRERLRLRAVQQILCPRIDPRQSGGGYDFAPLPALMRMGTPFFLAVLRRKGVLTSSAWDPYCYRPSLRVCELIAETTFFEASTPPHLEQSRVIHQALVDAELPDPTFGLWFAYPLDDFAHEGRSR